METRPKAQYDKNHSGKHSAGEPTHRLRQRIFELRREGVSFPVMAKMLGPEFNKPDGFTQGYMYQQYKRGLKAIVHEDVTELRKMELARLDQLQEEVVRILRNVIPLTNQGRVVVDYLEDEHGRPVLDEEGNPIPVKLKDQSIQLAAISRAVQIMERRAKLLGLDAPTKVAATDPSGEKEASLVQFYLPSNGRDVEPVET